MRILGVLILLLLVGVLAFGFYVLWLNLPTEPVKYEDFSADLTSNIDTTGLSTTAQQFYPSMRFQDKIISYYIEPLCNTKKKTDTERAFSTLASNTILTFHTDTKEKANILVLCSELAPEPEAKGHFVAGEGGPSKVINTTTHSVILSAKISLFRDDKCANPQIALHELLHALGFDHNNNPESIMYPATDCEQSLDKNIIDRINKIYALESLPDLAIEKVEASKAGAYLSFDITIANIGLQSSKTATLLVSADDEEIKEFDLGEIDIGTKKVLTVQNIKIPRKSDSAIFTVNSGQTENSQTNNKAEIKILKE